MTNNEVIERSFAELQAQMQKHHEVLRMVVEGTSPAHSCPWNACSHQQLLRSLLLEAVQVLEETRKSFKSKQLEQLRKRLLRALSEETSHETNQKGVLVP